MIIKHNTIDYNLFDFDLTYIKFKHLTFDNHVQWTLNIHKTSIPKNVFISLIWDIKLIETLTKSTILDFNATYKLQTELQEFSKDSKEIRVFLENAYMNLQMYYEDKAPQTLAHITLSSPNYDAIVLEIMDTCYNFYQ